MLSIPKSEILAVGMGRYGKHEQYQRTKNFLQKKPHIYTLPPWP